MNNYISKTWFGLFLMILTLSCTNSTETDKKNTEFTTCGDNITDATGNVYKTVLIGNQCWLAENMRMEENRWSYYENNSEFEKTFGKLYGFIAANKICPDGWTLPDEGDWRILIEFLGGSSVAGGKLKSSGTEYWDAPNEGATNESGFNSLPGGYANGDGYEYDSELTYFAKGKVANWWTSSQINEESEWFDFRLYYDDTETFFGAALPGDQRSVRCILD